MFDYSVGILTLIMNLKARFYGVNQPWWSENSGALGTFARVEAYFSPLELHGPGRGYYPKPSKIVLIVHPENI